MTHDTIDCPTGDTARQRGEAGFTIVEMLVALAVFAGILVGVGVLLESTSQATDYLTGSSEMDAALQRTLAEFAVDLKCAPIGRTVIESDDTDHDALMLQVPDPTALKDPEFGYFDSDGVFRADWWAYYLVVGDTLVRRRLDASFASQGEETLCGYVDTFFDRAEDGVISLGKGKGANSTELIADQAASTGKGLTITAVDSLVTVDLRLFEAAYSGDQRRSARITVMQVAD